MKTLRTDPQAPGRLFPAFEWETGWSLSAQADRFGYACSPKESLDCLEEYDTVEVAIFSPLSAVVDPLELGLPEAIAKKFTALEPGCGPSLGCELTLPELMKVREIIDRVHRRTDVGIPQGVIGWPWETVYFGTSSELAEGIVASGLSMLHAEDGCAGRAVYCSRIPEAALGFGFSSTHLEAAVTLVLEGDIVILDMRNSRDAARWRALEASSMQDPKRRALAARAAGIDGIYDQGRIALYETSRVAARSIVERAELGNNARQGRHPRRVR